MDENARLEVELVSIYVLGRFVGMLGYWDFGIKLEEVKGYTGDLRRMEKCTTGSSENCTKAGEQGTADGMVARGCDAKVVVRRCMSDVTYVTI